MASSSRCAITRNTKPDVVADATAVARVAPVTCAHVNSLGRYDLHVSRRPLDTCDRCDRSSQPAKEAP